MTKRRAEARKKAAWSAEVGERVVAALRGGMSADELARQPWGPSRWALARWMKVRPAFGAAVRSARQAAAADARAGAAEGWQAARTQAAAATVAAMAGSGLSVRGAAMARGDLPSAGTLDEWLRRWPGFAAAVEAARGEDARRHYGATGRPRLYGVEAEAQVLMRIAEGETLSAICRGEGMPSSAAVQHWRWSRPGFGAALDQARAAQAEAMADAVVDIADAAEAGLWALQKARLRMEARRWTVAARTAPRGQAAAPSGAAAMSPQERERRIAQLLEKARG